MKWYIQMKSAISLKTMNWPSINKDERVENLAMENK